MLTAASSASVTVSALSVATVDGDAPTRAASLLMATSNVASVAQDGEPVHVCAGVAGVSNVSAVEAESS